MPSRFWPRFAVAAYALLWVVLAIGPADRPTWILENVLVAALWLALAALYRWFRLSDGSLAMILAFLALHALGSHYTYSEVPYDAWIQTLTGRGLDARMGWDRNQFDRLVHFAYGLLFVVPVREFLLRVIRAPGFWSYFLPLNIILGTSALYELIEWGAAIWFGGDLGMHYLGTQGDVWDAHKDMALAGAGGLLAMLCCALADSAGRRSSRMGR
uniref:DUF2238 domain-containing protein n=1 Tax=Castellaniella defragrans TaxID=75697 RepID=UPI00333FC889